MNRARGRPAGGMLDRAGIAGAALALLREAGTEAVTVRRVAARLGVTPMAVLAHVGSRDGMVAAMLEAAFAGVDRGDAGPPDARIVAALERYGAAALAAPGAVTLMLSRPDMVPEVLGRLTAGIADALRATGMAEAEAQVVRDILVDHSHGVLVAAALAPADLRGTAAKAHEVAVRHLVKALVRPG